MCFGGVHCPCLCFDCQLDFRCARSPSAPDALTRWLDWSRGARTPGGLYQTSASPDLQTMFGHATIRSQTSAMAAEELRATICPTRWSETLNALVAVQAEDAVGIEILADVLGQLPGRPPCFAQGDLSDGNVAEQRDVDESSSTCRLDLAVADGVPDGEVHVQTMASRVPLW